MGLDVSKLKEKFERKSSDRGNRMELKDGDNELRILPPSLEYLADSVDYIGYEYLIHYNLGSEDDKQAEVCPKTFGKGPKCPVCEAVSKLYRLNTPEDKALAGTIRAKKRHIFNVIDLREPDKGIQIMETGPKIYESIVVFVTNPKWGDLLDLDKGRNITITKTDAKKSGTGYIEYSVAPDPTQESIREKLPKEFKTAIAGLQKSIPVAKSYDDLKAILEGEPVSSAPVKDQRPEVVTNVSAGPSAAVSEKPAPSVQQEIKVEKNPVCFGKDYGPRKEECTKCAVKSDCRTEFLKV